MGLFETTMADIIAKKERKEKGLHNSVPFPFSRWLHSVDGFDPGTYYQILGGTNTGKSKLKRYFIYKIAEFAFETGYQVKVLDFSLEDDRKEVYKKTMSHYLWKHHKEDLGLKYMNSRESPLNQKYIDLLQQDSGFFNEYDQIVNVINGATSPDEIFNICKRAHDKWGSTHQIITFVDNISNITKDPQDSNEFEAIKRWSRNIARLKLCKEMQMTIVDIMQLDFDSEKFAHRNANKGTIASVEPSLSSIGDSKISARNSHVIMALFSPNRYDIHQYPNSDGYNIDVLRDNFRSLLMLKNSHGELGGRLPLLFDGKHENFDELPRLEDRDALDKIYREIVETEKQKLAKYGSQKSMF